MLILRRAVSLFKTPSHRFSFCCIFPALPWRRCYSFAKETWCPNKPKNHCVCFQACRQITWIQSSLYHPGQLPVYNRSQLQHGGRPWGCGEGNQPCMSQMPGCWELGGTGCLPPGTKSFKTSPAARWGTIVPLFAMVGRRGAVCGGCHGAARCRQGCYDPLPGAELWPLLSIGKREKKSELKH